MKNQAVNPALKSAAFAGTALLLGILFNVLFFQKTPGISVLIYVAAVMGGVYALASYLRRPLPNTVLWLMAPLGFFSAMVAVRASDLLTFLNVVASLMLLLLVARITYHDDLRKFRLFDYAKVPFLPFKFLVPLGRTVGDFFTAGQSAKDHRLAGQITRGVLLAIPVLIVFMVLFASADLVFQKYVTAAFDFHLSDATIVRTIMVTFVTLAFTGAFAYIFGRTEKGNPTDFSSARAPLQIGQVESSILLGSVSALFFLFILVQLAYLFGGLSNISGQAFTYAEYARKGFFELLAAAMVAFGLLWATDKTVAKSASGHGMAFRILSSVLIAEVILIMVSAFKRLYLYEQAFGFTTLRLYSHVFVIFLAVIFVLLLVKIHRNQPENRIALPAFITAILFLAGMNILNPDAFIARQNLDRFHETGKLDAAYIGGLSEDAQSEINTAISVTSGETQQVLVGSQATRNIPTDWQSWNLSRSQSAK